MMDAPEKACTRDSYRCGWFSSGAKRVNGVFGGYCLSKLNETLRNEGLFV